MKMETITLTIKDVFISVGPDTSKKALEYKRGDYDVLGVEVLFTNRMPSNCDRVIKYAGSLIDKKEIFEDHQFFKSLIGKEILINEKNESLLNPNDVYVGLVTDYQTEKDRHRIRSLFQNK